MKEFRRIENQWDIDTNSFELHTATGRARCRICGEKIAKGENDVQFYASFTDGGSYNPWTAVLCHAHRRCVPDVVIEYDCREKESAEEILERLTREGKLKRA